MSILLTILILIGFAVLFISINKDRGSSNSSLKKDISKSCSTDNLPSPSTQFYSLDQPKTSNSKAFSVEFSADLPELSSELRMNQDKYIQLYYEALSLYKSDQVDLASRKFRDASFLMIQIHSKYPNNLRINFDLLEAYQGCDWRQAIQQGFKCLEIVDKLLCQESLSQKELIILKFYHFDVMRKLYKLLIKENKLDDAQLILEKFLRSINLFIETTILLDHVRMYGLYREERIASFFLQGIKEGRNIQRNLIVSPLTADDSPEFNYYFDAKSSSADSKILSELRNLLS